MADDEVRVRALTGHTETADPDVDAREEGETYYTTPGLARRRERVGLVVLDPGQEAPSSETEAQEDAAEAVEDDQASDSEPEVEESPEKDEDDTAESSPQLMDEADQETTEDEQ